MAELVSRPCTVPQLTGKTLSAAQHEQVKMFEFAWREMTTGTQVLGARMCDVEFFREFERPVG